MILAAQVLLALPVAFATLPRGAMQTYVKEKRYLHGVFSSRQDSRTRPQTNLEHAILSVVSVRFEAFRDHFGREPLPDEPLFFNPEADPPVPANDPQLCAQILDACHETGVALSLLIKFCNLLAPGVTIAAGDLGRAAGA